MTWHVVTSENHDEVLSAAVETKAAALELARALQTEGLYVLRLEASDGEVVEIKTIEPSPDPSLMGRRRTRVPPAQTKPAGRWNR
jgi:hypothetical protein